LHGGILGDAAAQATISAEIMQACTRTVQNHPKTMLQSREMHKEASGLLLRRPKDEKI
jgi:hypothetical protein